MTKLIAAILILIHVHHSLVMIAGDVMQVKVVAAAVKAGIPLFEHNGNAAGEEGHEATDSLEVEDADICSRTSLLVEAGDPGHAKGTEHADKPRRAIFPVHDEILTPPPQA